MLEDSSWVFVDSSWVFEEPSWVLEVEAREPEEAWVRDEECVDTIATDVINNVFLATQKLLTQNSGMLPSIDALTFHE